MKSKSIFIANSNRLMCDVLQSYCQSLGLNVIGTSVDGEESMQIIEQVCPDFVIIEAAPPAMDGIQITEKLNEDYRPIYIILYLHDHNPERLRKAMSVGVNSVFFADDGIAGLYRCFGQSGVGELSVGFSEQAFKELNLGDDPQWKLLESLTPAQLRILSMVSTHKTMPEIANELFLSRHTVNNHVANIRRKLNLHGRGRVLKYALAIKDRLIEVDGKIQILDSGLNYSNAS